METLHLAHHDGDASHLPRPSGKSMTKKMEEIRLLVSRNGMVRWSIGRNILRAG